MAPTSVAQLSSNVAGQLGKTLAMFFQYLVPLAFIIGAGVSAEQTRGIVRECSRKRTSVRVERDELERVRNAGGRGIPSWRLHGERNGWRRCGWRRRSEKNCEKSLVQCKQWKAQRVGVTIIRELYGVMAASGAVGGFVVTSGTFTQEAKDFAAGRNIDLIDGTELREIIKRVRPAGASEQKDSIDGRAAMPKVRQPDGDAHCQAGHECRQEFLGLPQLSAVPRSRADRLTSRDQ